MNVYVLTCLTVRNLRAIGPGSERANEAWLSSAVCAVGDGVSVVMNSELATILSYCK